MILQRRRGECVCVAPGVGEEQRGIFLFNLPSQGWWLQTAHPLSDSGDFCVWHRIIWYSTLPRKTIGREWELKQGQIVPSLWCAGGWVSCSGGCKPAVTPPWLLCPLWHQSVSISQGNSCVSQSPGTGSAALGWGRSTTAPTAWARDAPPLIPWECLREGTSSWIILGWFPLSYVPKLRRVLITYYQLKKQNKTFWMHFRSFANEQGMFESLGWWANKSGRRKPRS